MSKPVGEQERGQPGPVDQSGPAADDLSKGITIQIGHEDIGFLKQNKYKLCVAKRVNTTCNVVWQASDRYLNTNTFRWQPTYELFGSDVFQDGMEVRTVTNQVPIGLGQESTLDASRVLGPARGAGASTVITLRNNYGPIHPGLCAPSTGIDGLTSTTPIYVSENQIATGVDTLTPVEIVHVWFEQRIVTSTMFSTTVSAAGRSKVVIIDMTATDTATRLYSDGRWSTPPAGP